MTHQAWFANWFDTPWYHLLYNNRSHEEAASFIQNLIQLLNPPSGAKALDLACGKGRHSITLHHLGMHVTGVDLSPASILEASEKATDGLQFKVHDMRLPLAARFDYIFNLFTSLGYFETVEEDLEVFRSISAMLAPQGVAIIDFMNAEKVIQNLVPEEIQERGSIKFSIKRVVTEDNIIRKHIQVITEEGVFDFEERVRGYRLADFEMLVLKSGLKIHQTFGNYGLSPFSASDSDRLILVIKHA